MKGIDLWRGAVLAATVLGTSALLAGGHDGDGDRRLPPVTNAAWQAECSSCHEPYHPGLLPARSWRTLMGDLGHHFGDNAALDPVTRDDIARFLVANAADVNGNRRSAKIAASIPASTAPLRITETGYVRAKHDEIRADVWRRPAVGSRANCAACHRTAGEGDFSERNVAIPKAGPTAVAAGRR
ncbi:MAG: diheme cytochrome c [Betaproteobacteria bacterium]